MPNAEETKTAETKTSGRIFLKYNGNAAVAV